MAATPLPEVTAVVFDLGGVVFRYCPERRLAALVLYVDDEPACVAVAAAAALGMQAWRFTDAAALGKVLAHRGLPV